MLNNFFSFNSNIDLNNTGLLVFGGSLITTLCFCKTPHLTKFLNSHIQSWVDWFLGTGIGITQEQVSNLSEQVFILDTAFELLVRPLSRQSIVKVIDHRSLVDLQDKLKILDAMLSSLINDSAVMQSSFADQLIKIKSKLLFTIQKTSLLEEMEFKNTDFSKTNDFVRHLEPKINLAPKVADPIVSVKTQLGPVWQDSSILYGDLNISCSEYFGQITDYIHFLINTTPLEFFPAFLQSPEAAICVGSLLTVAFLSGDIPEKDMLGYFYQRDLTRMRILFLEINVAQDIFNNSFTKTYPSALLDHPVWSSWSFLDKNYKSFPHLFEVFQKYGKK